MRRRRGRGLFLLALIVMVGAGAAMAHYTLRGDASSVTKPVLQLYDKVRNALGASAATATAANVPEKGVTVDADGDITVYFAPCNPMNPFGIDDALIRCLSGAKRNIYAAFYELNLQPAADALIERHRAGVEVRLVGDSDYADDAAMQSCIQAGIPVVFDGRKAFMHDKFCVVDGTSVWTGSTNITDNCMYRNDNNSLLIASPALAADYSTEFHNLFDLRHFGSHSPSREPNPVVQVGDTVVECYFSPEDNVAKEVVAEIDEATVSVDFMAFCFTAKKIAHAMAKRMEHGVAVRGIFDARQANAASSQKDFLSERGARVRIDKNPYTMHNKVIVVDAKTVVTGSYNFTKAAEEDNDENVLIIHSPAIAAAYEKKFEELFAE